ncbi:hypothetical protein ALI22I_44120 [Saccharothrix sp. ALI-22-I]|uniref:hypothetical protein n=1 Tax=Saccharothrix sp. ALI-22-I TaxID=1933778 RepID=UPI00097CB589|nr:hypothetical protein [Saccharothrix sp. ALI-22-I]ONI80338.1 hypothetical protein ALI22I_44120 [Saccharothrix sp. ALI-22-I]
MADERSRTDRTRSEQQEGLEMRRGTGQDRAWQRDAEAAAPQYTEPDDDGDFTDDEPTAIADEAGSSYPGGPEHQAMHIEENRD